MFKQISKISFSLNNITKSFYFPFCSFSSPSSSTTPFIYTPFLPLTQPYTPLFMHQTYTQGKAISLPSLLYFMIPSFAIFINNMLTSWSIISSSVFVAANLLSIYSYIVIKVGIGVKIHDIQVDHPLEHVYLSFTRTPINSKFISSNGFTLSKQEHMILVNMPQHPMKVKYPNTTLTNNMFSFLYIKDPKLANELMNIQSKLMDLQTILLRAKIPLNRLKFTLILQQNKKKQFERDLERLTEKQLLTKYQNHNIIIELKGTDKKYNEGKYIVDVSKNMNKRYHDYLIALALGYKIDNTDNKINPKWKNWKKQLFKAPGNVNKQNKNDHQQDTNNIKQQTKHDNIKN